MSSHAAKFDARANATAARLESQIKIAQMPMTAGPVTFWEVRGKIIRDKVFIDYTEGGNGAKYKWMPRHEIWLDTDIDKSETMAVALHELHEYNKMNGGMTYDRAHDSANVVEQEVRNDPSTLRKLWQHEVAIVTAWAKRGEKKST